ncbi:BRCA1-associated RING domain protein 1-like isoform X2 [Dysidea avara]
MCPVCNIPIWSKDLQPNCQLSNVVSLVQHMKCLIAEDLELETKQRVSISAEPNSIKKESTTPIVVSHDAVSTGGKEQSILCQFSKKLKSSSTDAEIKKPNTVVVKSESSDGNNSGQVATKKWELRSIVAEEMTGIRDEISQPKTKRRRVLASSTLNTHRALKERSSDSPFSPIFTKTRSFKRTLPTSSLVTQQASVSHDTRRDCNENERLMEVEASRIVKKLKTSKRVNHKGETILHLLAIKGDIAGIDQHLQNGEDPNVKDYAGWTPLHEACNHGHRAIVELLLSNGALVNIPGYANCTPLHDAVVNGHVDIVKLLVNKGADPSIRNKYGKVAEDLTDSLAIKRALNLSGDAELLPQALLKSPHASPILNGGPLKVVLLGTSLKVSQKAQFVHASKKFNAKICDTFTTDVTHVVTPVDKGCCPRTLKYLYAVAAAKWIVSYNWITDSLSKNEWADETLYEVRGCTTSTECICSEAPRKSRENLAKGAPGIFDGCQFYFYGTFIPPKASKEDLTYLVTLANGVILNREPKSDNDDIQAVVEWPYHFKGKDCLSSTFIVYDPWSKSVPTTTELHVTIVPASWILDCLSHFELKL